MEIRPYKSFGALAFGYSTREDCLQLLGHPLRIETNWVKVVEFHYDQFIVRFDPVTHTVRECTLLPRTDATIDDINVTWDKEFLLRLCERDGSPKNAYGFIVLNHLGIAVTGIHDDDESQLAITVFSEGDLDDLLSKSIPFSFSAE